MKLLIIICRVLIISFVTLGGYIGFKGADSILLDWGLDSSSREVASFIDSILIGFGFTFGVWLGVIGAFAIVFPLIFKYPKLDLNEHKKADKLLRRFLKWYGINLAKLSGPNSNQ